MIQVSITEKKSLNIKEWAYDRIGGLCEEGKNIIGFT